MRYNDGHPFPNDYPRVTVAPGLQVTSPVGIRLNASKDPAGFPYGLEAEVSVVDGRFGVTKLTFSQGESGQPITSGWLAKSALWTHVLGAVFVSESLVFYDHEVNGHIFTAQASPEEAYGQISRELLTLPSPREDLHLLGLLYRLARLGFYDPTQSIAGTLGVSSSTVRRWLSEAVVAGELSASERKK